MFAAMDADGDGFVTSEEVHTFLHNMLKTQFMAAIP